MQIEVNGEAREIADGISLSELVASLAFAPERIVIEHNREVVRRAAWDATLLSEGDRIEIVHFVGGGRRV
jgi:thiamine biosynthesis protein ThiS